MPQQHRHVFLRRDLWQRADYFANLAIPRSTLAKWVDGCGMQLQPLVDAMMAELLTQPVLHADETPVAMLDQGAGKTHRADL